MSKIKLSSNASGTGNVTVSSPATNSDRTITLPDGDGAMPLIKLETAKTATGTAVDFTSIPSWVKRITVMFSGVSTNGTNVPIVQIGDSGGFETTGYVGSTDVWQGSISADVFLGSGYQLSDGWSASYGFTGQLVLTLISSNSWVGCFNGALVTSAGLLLSTGSKTLSDTLTQIRITTATGINTFDAGTINIMYEG
jgi:hypothetical protein